ncbi:GNAT family N-acetyltransferase [Cytobacillus sp. FJAT-54145]|uniref:GNAT family N-acetyltransferase n=1 Tax=Cytobacillus spartinae TaxID=3299023 RepID=A0ABW6KI30_9BACI
MKFIKSNKTYIPIELAIMNSQPEHNLVSEDRELLTDEDLLEEHEEHKDKKERYLISLDDEFIGIVDFIMENPRDLKPWLGLFIVHKNWEGKGVAQEAYTWYENLMKARGVGEVRLGCFKNNLKGLTFWRRQKYEIVKEIDFKEKPMFVLEKKLS